MASIVWTDVTAAAPQLASVAVTSQNDILAVANVRFNIAVFDGEAGVTTRLARILYAAHLAALTKLGVSGPLIGESADGLSRSYAAPFMGRSQLALTSYGAALLAILPPVTHGPMVL